LSVIANPSAVEGGVIIPRLNRGTISLPIRRSILTGLPRHPAQQDSSQ